MNYSTVLSLFLGYVSVSQVAAGTATPPVRARLNAEVFERVFHKRDQEILKVFSNMKLTPGHGEAVKANRLENLSASLAPKDGVNFDDLDFELHLQKDFFGAQSSELQYQGTGEVAGAKFSFSGPVDMFRLKYTMSRKFSEQLNFEQNLFEEQEFLLDTPAAGLTVTGADLTDDERALLLSRLSSEVTSIKDTASAGKVEAFGQFPVDTIIPFVVLYYGA
jgi:hypothetical protein